MDNSSGDNATKLSLGSQKPLTEDDPQVIPYQVSLSYIGSGEDSVNGKHHAYGFAALNYIRLAWKLEAEGVADAELIQRLISQLMIDDAMKITNELKSNSVMHIEDLLKIPIFEEVVASSLALDSVAEKNWLKNTLSNWFVQKPKKVQAAILDRYQETIICLRIPLFDSAIYMSLDPHPRTNHPDGPAVIIAKNLDDILAPIHNILLNGQLPEIVASDEQFSVHCLDSKPDIDTLDIKDLIARSVAYLSKRSAAFSTSEHIASMRSRAEQQLRKMYTKPSMPDQPDIKSHSAPHYLSTHRETLGTQSSGDAAHNRSEGGWHCALLSFPVSVSSDTGPAIQQMSWPPSLDKGGVPIHTLSLFKDKPSLEESTQQDADPAIAIGDDTTLKAENSSMVLHKPLSCGDGKGSEKLQPEVTSADINVHTSARILPTEHDPMISLSLPLNAIWSGSNDSWETTAIRPIQGQEIAMVPSSTSAGSSFVDWNLRMQLQQEIDDLDFGERRPIYRSSSSSVINVQLPLPYASFECGVCGELVNTTSRIDLPGCGHEACKECLTAFSRTKIDEGRYPIFCPECIAERSGAIRTRMSEDIFKQLALPEEHLKRLQELQMASHSINLQCPRCREIMHVARIEFNELSIIICPLSACGHKWCKSCMKTLARSQHRHRCKNKSIDRLMKRKGWKYCPGCRTPVQKDSGCNHMTCAAPGCNVHFCYKCGVLMIDTTNGGDVGTAVTDHYNECRLFDRKWPQCSIQ